MAADTKAADAPKPRTDLNFDHFRKLLIGEYRKRAGDAPRIQERRERNHGSRYKSRRRAKAANRPELRPLPQASDGRIPETGRGRTAYTRKTRKKSWQQIQKPQTRQSREPT